MSPPPPGWCLLSELSVNDYFRLTDEGPVHTKAGDTSAAVMGERGALKLSRHCRVKPARVDGHGNAAARDIANHGGPSWSKGTGIGPGSQTPKPIG